MSVSTQTMKELLEREGTPPKYRKRYLWLGEHLLQWRFRPELGAWDTGSGFLPEGVALRMLRSHVWMEAVIATMFGHGWLVSITTFQTIKTQQLCYQVQFADVVGSGGLAVSTNMVDAVLLAAWRAHRRLLNAEKLEGRPGFGRAPD